MQSTGHTSTHAVSLVPMQGSVITYAILSSRSQPFSPAHCRESGRSVARIVLQVLRSSGPQVLRFSGSQVLRFSGSRVLGCSGARVLACSGSRVLGWCSGRLETARYDGSKPVPGGTRHVRRPFVATRRQYVPSPVRRDGAVHALSLIHISEPTRLLSISYA